MKALSRKRRGGRPKLSGERYPSGKRKPSETEKEVKSVVISARMRQHGYRDQQAKGDLAGHVLGRIYLDGKITKPMFEAGLRYCDDVWRYYSNVLGRSPTVSAQNLLKVRGFDGDISTDLHERHRRAANVYMILEKVLQEHSRAVKTTVFNVCVEDLEAMRFMPESQMELFRKGLNVLIWHYGINEK